MAETIKDGLRLASTDIPNANAEKREITQERYDLHENLTKQIADLNKKLLLTEQEKERYKREVDGVKELFAEELLITGAREMSIDEVKARYRGYRRKQEELEESRIVEHHRSVSEFYMAIRQNMQSYERRINETVKLFNVTMQKHAAAPIEQMSELGRQVGDISKEKQRNNERNMELVLIQKDKQINELMQSNGKLLARLHQLESIMESMRTDGNSKNSEDQYQFAVLKEQLEAQTSDNTSLNQRIRVLEVELVESKRIQKVQKQQLLRMLVPVYQPPLDTPSGSAPNRQEGHETSDPVDIVQQVSDPSVAESMSLTNSSTTTTEMNTPNTNAEHMKQHPQSIEMKAPTPSDYATCILQNNRLKQDLQEQATELSLIRNEYQLSEQTHSATKSELMSMRTMYENLEKKFNEMKQKGDNDERQLCSVLTNISEINTLHKEELEKLVQLTDSSNMDETKTTKMKELNYYSRQREHDIELCVYTKVVDFLMSRIRHLANEVNKVVIAINDSLTAGSSSMPAKIPVGYAHTSEFRNISSLLGGTVSEPTSTTPTHTPTPTGATNEHRMISSPVAQSSLSPSSANTLPFKQALPSTFPTVPSLFAGDTVVSNGFVLFTNMEYLKEVVVKFISFPRGSSERVHLYPVLKVLLSLTERDMKIIKGDIAYKPLSLIPLDKPLSNEGRFVDSDTLLNVFKATTK